MGSSPDSKVLIPFSHHLQYHVLGKDAPSWGSATVPPHPHWVLGENAEARGNAGVSQFKSPRRLVWQGRTGGVDRGGRSCGYVCTRTCVEAEVNCKYGSSGAIHFVFRDRVSPVLGA